MELLKRRTFIKNAALGAMASVIATNTQAKMSTPREAEGPFYPITPQKDQDADLTRVEGKSGIAKGEIIEISGQVVDQDLNPIEDVTIDLWQANSFGKYHHAHDTSEAPIDEYFQSWAIIQSGTQGQFKFKTVIPGAYPLNSPQQRTPHIHLKVGKHGYVPLLTQMYFPNQPLNEKDGMFKRKSVEEQAMMTAKRLANSNQYQYDIIIEKL